LLVLLDLVVLILLELELELLLLKLRLGLMAWLALVAYRLSLRCCCTAS
jgi:hypothetical protein